MTYHYIDSGLDNVYLENGYELHPTPYGEGVSIQNTEGLHRAIGAWLIEYAKPLNGAELRFLRLEMELSQKSLAETIGSEEQNVRRWEKARNKPINGAADRLLRALYAEYIGADGSIHRIVERLRALNVVEKPEARLRDDNGWRLAPAV